MIKDINNFRKKQYERMNRGILLQRFYNREDITFEERKKLRLEQDRSYKMFDFMKKLKIEMEKENVR
jgi:hypothetical protein